MLATLLPVLSGAAKAQLVHTAGTARVSGIAAARLANSAAAGTWRRGIVCLRLTRWKCLAGDECWWWMRACVESRLLLTSSGPNSQLGAWANPQPRHVKRPWLTPRAIRPGADNMSASAHTYSPATSFQAVSMIECATCILFASMQAILVHTVILWLRHLLHL